MNHEYRTFQVTSPDPADNPWYPAWLTAVQQGFHDPHPTDRFLRHQLAIEAAHGSVARGVWSTDSPEYALGADIPVATFMEWRGSLNVGGSLIDCHQISDVTVRASHRRQGIARNLMTASLTQAKESGLAVAALTATEATIYGRFGFGAAIFKDQIELRVGSGFDLQVPVTGTCEYLSTDRLAEAATEVFRTFHATQTGSIDRNPPQMELRTGLIVKSSREANTKIRAIGHWDDDGTLDGYATWTSSDREDMIRVIDFVPTNQRASTAMWSFLASLDLVRRVRFNLARNDEHLPWAITDRRRYIVREHDDLLWLRPLDPARLLTARNYYADGDVRLRVVDKLGIAEGTWDLHVRDGHATCEPTDAEPQVEIGVAALGSTVLGGVNIHAMSTVGNVTGEQPAIDELGILLRRRREPWCITPF
ncbi:GNAT family N-acetyltransferase [uncultured Tessaracoccus sp.]|uniref:GNAT family N-acetyltransferase n=1 Tax=uncultured Tessaracoccus sp. TaxID=905023 RepID=UPI0025EEF243|nr:GNAT family N-acetyltransferase [uncultured Tessaracoccus sp.]